MPLRIVFAGTPEFAAHHLQTLLDSPHHIIGVYTQPDRPAGRGKQLTASPVKQLAEAHSVPVFQPKSLKDHTEHQVLTNLKPDIMVVVAYGLLLPLAVLECPRLGCINVHASILPRWRGAAPIQRAIAAGDSESGVTIMQMDEGLDTGGMLVKRTCPIYPTDTGGDLHDRLLGIGGEALLSALEQLATNTATPETQNNALSSYAGKLSKEEASITWAQSALDIERMIRAFNPFPVAHTRLAGKSIRIWEASPSDTPIKTEREEKAVPGEIIAVDNDGLLVACADQALRLTVIQMPGKKAMPVAQLLNGYRDTLAIGEVFL